MYVRMYLTFHGTKTDKHLYGCILMRGAQIMVMLES